MKQKLVLFISAIMITAITMAQVVENYIIVKMPYVPLTGLYTISWIADNDTKYDMSKQQYFVQFNDESRTVSGTICNDFSGQYNATMAKSIQFDKIISTKKMCVALADEQLWFKVLDKAQKFKVEGDQLLLLENGKVIATLDKIEIGKTYDSAKNPDETNTSIMVNSQFVITAVNDEGTWLALDTKNATLLYDATAKHISGKAVCNNYAGNVNFTINNDGKTGKIKVEQIATTTMICTKGLKSEALILSALHQVSEFSIEGNVYVLKANNQPLLKLQLI